MSKQFFSMADSLRLGKINFCSRPAFIKEVPILSKTNISVVMLTYEVDATRHANEPTC